MTPVYLWRAGNPASWAAAFLESYRRFDPGPGTRLVLLLKGFETPPPLPEGFACATEAFAVDDTGFDLTAYLMIARARPEAVFLFLNSHSLIRAQGWHAAFADAFARTGGTGLIGASGSWEATGDCPDFPNPHIRTNAFACRARDYAEAAPSPLATRAECLAFEAGRQSLTRWFLARGRAVRVIDARGQAWEVEDWPKSRTFRLADQEDLLVSDNRSQKYHLGTPARRRHHARASWGAAVVPGRRSPVTWLRRLLWERVLYFGQRPRALARLLTLR